VRALMAGQLSMPDECRSLFEKPALSPREKQIMAMLVMGFPNQEIADRLFVTESTIKSHLASAFKKLGVRSRGEATAVILDPNTGLGLGVLALTQGEELEPLSSTS